MHTPEFKFIRDKIYRLHSAVMYSMSNELIKIPNSIITLLRMDEEGHMWFECKAPVVYMQHYEQSFPARLHFFRKGFNYFIDVNGSALIVNSNSDPKKKDGTLLMKMFVNNIEYVEPQAKKKTWIDRFLETSYNWLLNNLAIPRHTKPLLTKLQHHR